jgi:hypothetical protein
MQVNTGHLVSSILELSACCLQNKLAAGEAELDGLRTMITAARERDAFRCG